MSRQPGALCLFLASAAFGFAQAVSASEVEQLTEGGIHEQPSVNDGVAAGVGRVDGACEIMVPSL